jgi:hypothetical protein
MSGYGDERRVQCSVKISDRPNAREQGFGMISATVFAGTLTRIRPGSLQKRQ